MYIFKFNKIIIELINDYLSCSDSKKYKNEGVKENLFKLYESIIKINNKQYLEKEEQEDLLVQLGILEKTILEKEFMNYKMPKDFSKPELDNINKEFYSFIGMPEKYNSNEDFSTIPFHIIIYYIKRKYPYLLKKYKEEINFINF